MAIVHLSGTKLAPQRAKAPLNKQFMYAMGLTLMVAMHFFVPAPTGTGLQLSFNSFTWIAFSFALGLGFYQTARNRIFRYTKLTIALLVSCIILTIPVLYISSYPEGVIERLTGLWAGWLLFFVMQQFSLSNRHRQRLLWFIVIAVVIQALFGYVQYLFPENVNILGINLYSEIPFGVFHQSDVMASFLATGTVLSGYLLARQQQKYGQRLSRTTLLYIMPIITTPLIVALFSLTGWIGTLLGITLVIPYLYRFSTKRRLIGWALSAISGIALGILLSFSMGNSDKVLESNHLEGLKGTPLAQVIDMFIEKPFSGYGYGRFEPEYMIYTARQHQLNQNYPSGLPSMEHPQNELLYWGVEGGIVSILGIAIAVIFVLVKLASVRKGTRLAILSLFIPILLHTLAGDPFYHSAAHWITFIILLFWLDQRSANYKNYHFSNLSKHLLRLGSLLLPVITTLFMTTAIYSGYVLMKFESSSPKDPVLLDQVVNKVVWKEQSDKEIYGAYLKLGLASKDPELINPYIEWSTKLIRQKPRVELYQNLILAYQAIGHDMKAEQIRDEAYYLFPSTDFSEVQITIDTQDETPVQKVIMEGIGS